MSWLSAHLLDGMLGRAAALLAVALLTGAAFWQYGLHVPVPSRSRIITIAISLGLIGVALSLNSSFFQWADSLGEGATLPWDALLPLLLQTQYGQVWLAYGLLLLLTAVSWPRCYWLGLNLLGLVVCSAINSHAAEQGLSLLLGWHVVHLACMLCWLGGVLMIGLTRLAQLGETGQAALARFSAWILPVFLLGLVSGVARLAWAWAENGTLHRVYLLAIACKLILMLAVCSCAWRLRRRLRQSPWQGARYDEVLTIEFFFALLLLFAAALLTQLPPL